MTVYTLGYQGITIEEYIRTLHENNVKIVLDVRETPWSYKRDFSRSKFVQQLNDAGIEYVHVKSAGNPSSNRKTATSVQDCLSRYREYLSNDDTGVQDLAAHLRAAHIQGSDACLTCFEKEHEECHRSILIDFLYNVIPGLEVCHLQADKINSKHSHLIPLFGVP